MLAYQAEPGGTPMSPDTLPPAQKP